MALAAGLVAATGANRRLYREAMISLKDANARIPTLFYEPLPPNPDPITTSSKEGPLRVIVVETNAHVDRLVVANQFAESQLLVKTISWLIRRAHA